MSSIEIAHTLTTIAGLLGSTGARWQVLAETLPAELFFRSPEVGSWSARECLSHLIDTERHVFPVRVQAFLENQPFPAFDPDSQGSGVSAGTQPVAMVNELITLRKNGLEVLARVATPDLQLPGHHPELGAVTLGQLLHEWAAHDLSHTVQAERAVMNYLVEHCGPWDIYFDV